MDGPGFGGPRDRAHEPGVRGDPLALGGLLDGGLERLGQAQADPRRVLLTGDAGSFAGGVDEDELGLLAGEAHLDVAGGQFRGELHRDLREQVEQLQPQVRGERVAEPLGDLHRALVPQLREPLEILLEPLEDDRQVHRDITMTSHMVSVKQQAAVGCDIGPDHGRKSLVRCGLLRGDAVPVEVLEHVLGALHEGVLVVDAAGRRVYANDEAARLTGYRSVDDAARRSARRSRRPLRDPRPLGAPARCSRAAGPPGVRRPGLRGDARPLPVPRRARAGLRGAERHDSRRGGRRPRT